MVLKLTWKRTLAAVAALFLAGMAIAWSGVINIGASTGHWAITDWFLHWAMRNTVRTQAALTVDEPVGHTADTTELVSAAGHYAAQCAICHGAPGERPSPVTKAATPAPPDLSVTANTWSGRELFWIVKHGVKFTAMPAWPAQDRDDEVRRMAAFVARLPAMSPAEYRALAYDTHGHIATGKLMRIEDALPDCERCHADDGRGQADIPVLAGQKPGYLLAALHAFASGERSSAVMAAAAARVDGDVLSALADHYANQPRRAEPHTAPADPVAADPVTAGPIAAAPTGGAPPEHIVERGLPEADLPACASCHAAGKRPGYPVLEGQKAEYLAARLRLWRGDENQVDARKPSTPMPMIARRIPEHLIEPLARHFARQSPTPAR